MADNDLGKFFLDVTAIGQDANKAKHRQTVKVFLQRTLSASATCHHGKSFFFGFFILWVAPVLRHLVNNATPIFDFGDRYGVWTNTRYSLVEFWQGSVNDISGCSPEP